MKEEKHFHVFERGKEDSKVKHYDVCILGGGAAGMTAGIYSARYGLHTGLITKEFGGMTNLAARIENYPGFEGSGPELMQKFKKQVEKNGVEILTSEVAKLEKDKTGFIINLRNGKVAHTKTLIISLGTEKRKLNVEGEKELSGKGISYCATCDAFFFKNKVVGVIGGRNSAAKAVSILSNISKKIYLIYRGEKLKADKVEIDKIKKLTNVEIILNAVPKKFIGKQKLESLEIDQGGEIKKIKVDGVFIEAGTIPSTSIVKSLGIKIDKAGFIVVNRNLETNVPGVFAAGDSVESKLKQIVVAAGEGAVAARSAYDYLDRK